MFSLESRKRKIRFYCLKKKVNLISNIGKFAALFNNLIPMSIKKSKKFPWKSHFGQNQTDSRFGQLVNLIKKKNHQHKSHESLISNKIT